MLSFGVGIAIGLTVVVCVAVAVVLALLRWRQSTAGAAGSSARTELQLQEMEWDNSTFNITVNPLDHREDGFEDGILGDLDIATDGLPPPAADDDEMACSADELDVESVVVDVTKQSGCKELEWDDSTLSY